MSYEMFVQRFADGEAAPVSGSAFRAVWGTHTECTEPEFNLWHVRADDGGDAEIYARITGDALDSFMISRFSPGGILILLVEFLVAADAVLLAPGCPTMLVREDQRRHLPEELRTDVAVVRSGADVRRTLDSH